jgi:hypothetical protein
MEIQSNNQTGKIHCMYCLDRRHISHNHNINNLNKMSKFIHPDITKLNLKKQREAEEALKIKELEEIEEELFMILTQAH